MTFPNSFHPFAIWRVRRGVDFDNVVHPVVIRRAYNLCERNRSAGCSWSYGFNFHDDPPQFGVDQRDRPIMNSPIHNQTCRCYSG
jgi:hypothetical protein